jgi:hypothetical protein
MQKQKASQAQWFKPVILATWEAVIGRIAVQSQWLDMVAQSCHPNYKESQERKIMIQDSLCRQPMHKGKTLSQKYSAHKGLVKWFKW